MASAIIHICVAKEINKVLKVEEKELFLGSIAPDLSKQIGESKKKSHFLSTPKDQVPNILEFLKKYKDSLTQPFFLGYFIHLYTDKIWFDEFLRSKVYENAVRLLDGTELHLTKEQLADLIYKDYTNVNISLIERYDLDLSLFYEELPIPPIEMEEIPVSKLPILIEKMGVIIENSSQEKGYIFDISVIEDFIQYASVKILKKIEEYQLEVHP